jgi:hypothetical protein
VVLITRACAAILSLAFGFIAFHAGLPWLPSALLGLISLSLLAVLLHERDG